MLNKIFASLVVALLLSGTPIAFAVNAVPHGKVFSHFVLDLRSEEERGDTPRTAFELKRAYLGTKGKFNDDLGFNITYDVSQNGEAFAAFAKIAQLSWKGLIPQSTVNMGLVGMHAYKLAETAWGHRGVQKSGPDFWKLRTAADIGLTVVTHATDKLDINTGIFNGEGYKRVEKDGFKIVQVRPVYHGSGITLSPYLDFTQKEGADGNNSQVMVGGFVGYRQDRFAVGADGLFQTLDGTNSLLVWGFARYFVNDQFEAFVRADHFDPDQDKQDDDGQLVIVGVAHMPTKGVELALDYQFRHKSGKNRGQVFLHSTYSF